MRDSKGLNFKIIIDALDQCEHEKDVALILQLLLRLQGCASVKVGATVTSRPEIAVRYVPDEEVEHDLALYLIHEFGQIRRWSNLEQ